MRNILYIYIEYMISKQVDNIFKRAWNLFFTQLNGCIYIYLIWIIQFAINDLFIHILMFSSIDMYQ